MFSLKNLNKKIVSFYLITLLVVPSFFITNNKVDAIFVPVIDPAVLTTTTITAGKETIADFAINIGKRILVRTLVQDTVNWINNGFEGKPSWGQSLTHVLEDTTHMLLDDFLYSNEYTKGLCKGFDLSIKFAVQLNFYTKSKFGGERYTPRCTIESAKDSIEDVIENFYKNNNILSVSFDEDGNFEYKGGEIKKFMSRLSLDYPEKYKEIESLGYDPEFSNIDTYNWYVSEGDEEKETSFFGIYDYETPKNAIKIIIEEIVETTPDYSWDDFLEKTTNSDNNPFGVYFNLSDDLEREINRRTGKTEKELNNNSGFLSYRKCDEEGLKNAELANITAQGYGTDGFYENEDEYQEALFDAGDADYSSFDGSDRAEKHCPVTTPGTQLAASLNSSLGADQDEIITADEFDEIIGALVGQLMKKVLSGGVKGASGSSYDNNYADPNFVIAKNNLADKYKVGAYNVEVKVIESSLKTVTNAEKNQEDAIACWTDKESGNNLYRKVSDSNYEKIYSQSASIVLEELGNQVVEDRFDKSKDRLNRKIISVKKDRESAGDAAENILAAEDYGEFIEAKEAAEGINPANIQQEIQRRDFTNLVFDKMVNGDHTREFTGTKEYRSGGFNDLLIYCRSFDVQTAPSIYNNGNLDYPTVITDVSVKGVEERHTNTITIIDTYNPTEDIYDLDEYGYLEDNEIVEVVNPEGACIAKDKIVENGSENLYLQFYEPLEIGNCKKAINATCVDTKFIHSGLPSGFDYPNDFWLNNKDDSGNTTECGIKI